MDLFKDFPKPIQEFIINLYGQPHIITKVNGIKAEGECYRLGFSKHSIIIKQMADPGEYLFYKKCSPLFKEFSINLPSLYWSYEEGGHYWVVIEDIPYALPKERWQRADDHVLRALFHLHRESWGKNLPIENPYTPSWDNHISERVLALYPDEEAKQLQALLYKAQEESKQLFKPYCWISGDSNPTNWGVREDGTVVLFDWERITYGSPAIDLAIIMSGLGSPDDSLELSISKKYIALWSSAGIDFPLTERDLFQQIKLAKIWSVVEFLANNADLLDFDTRQLILKGLGEKLQDRGTYLLSCLVS